MDTLSRMNKTAENQNAGTLTVCQGDNRKANGYENFSHQNDAHQALSERILRTQNRPFSGILAIPTGGGKTFIAVEWLLKHWVSKGKKVLWIAHRHELLSQALNTFKKNTYESLLQNRETIRYRIVSGHHDKPLHIKTADDIIIASKDSLVRGMDYLIGNWVKPNRFDELFFVIDEAHHATAKTYRKLIKELQSHVPNLKILGLTATPFRTQEREKSYLHMLFQDDIVFKINLRTLIARKILSEPNFEEAATQLQVSKDLTEKDLHNIQKFDLPENIKTSIAEQKERNHLIVKHYVENSQKYGQCLVYALNKKHALTLQELFQSRNIRTDFVISDVQDEVYRINLSKENALKIEKFRKGELQVLINVNILTEGADLPKVQSVFLTRPTISKILMTQMIGRALRGVNAGGTETAYIVSFIDNWQDKIAWVNPKQLFALEGVDFEETDQKTQKRVIELVSIKKLQEFARLTDQTINTTELKKLDFLARIPVGLYVFSLLKADSAGESFEKNCEVLVYSHLQHPYSQFIQDLDRIFKTQGIDIENREVLKNSELERLCKSVRENYFFNEEFILGYQDEDIMDILLYYFDKQLAPMFIPLEDREKYDIDKIAREISERDLGPIARSQYENEIWKNEYSVWRTLFGFNKEHFLNEIHLAMTRIHHGAETFENLPQDQPKDSKELRQLEDLPLSEIYKYAPELAAQIKEEVYNNHKNEKGEYVCAVSGYTNAARLGFEIDHIVPLSKGGKTRPENLQLLVWWANRQKSDKMPLSGKSEPAMVEKREIHEAVNLALEGDEKQRTEIEAHLFFGDVPKNDLSAFADRFRKLAEDGNAYAQTIYGEMHFDGRGVHQDNMTALKWYEKAAEQQYPGALNSLGLIYSEGRRGIPVDEKKAFNLFKKGAEHGNALCQLNLGQAYYAGMGVRKSHKQAAKWYRKAAEQGNAIAQNFLALMYQAGEGVPQDYQTAAKWHKIAADQGLADAQNCLGVLYEAGKDVNEDKVEAFNLYRQAAEGGDVYGQQNLGRMYYYGAKGIGKDYAQAAYWYNQAAEQGNLESQKRLARMYAKGKGIEKNLELAYVWLSIAYEGASQPIKEFETIKKMLTVDQVQKANEMLEDIKRKINERLWS